MGELADGPAAGPIRRVELRVREAQMAAARMRAGVSAI